MEIQKLADKNWSEKSKSLMGDIKPLHMIKKANKHLYTCTCIMNATKT